MVIRNRKTRVAWCRILYFHVRKLVVDKNILQCILKTKSNFTVFISEYFYSWYDLTKLKHINSFPRLVPTECTKNDSSNWFHHRVTCTFIENKKLAFSKKFFNIIGICTQILKDQWSSIKSPAKHPVFLMWLTNGNNSKFLNIEIIPLWIKTITI